MWGLVFVISYVFAGSSAVVPNSDKIVQVQSLVTRYGLAWTLKNVVKNYGGFQPLGLVLVMMIGFGVTIENGLLQEGMKKLANVPDEYLVFSV